MLSHICFADDLILFAEASVTQIRVIRRVLERFCSASGQKVSLGKSKIFFSENVSRELGKRVSEESGISSTQDLGKYLEMHVLHKRINKDTFGYVLERVASRLAGWKSKCLSLAGRMTLTKAVLTSIPVHTMSTICLPKSLLDELDKVSRSFLWGSNDEKRRQHLVNWKRVCLPKSEGGLGVRSTPEMNKALVAKLGWRLLHDKTSLWALVLRSKYKVGDVHNLSWLEVKGNWSSTWRGIGIGLREVVLPGLSWVVGNGRRARFWMDKWITNSPLVEWGLGVLPPGSMEIRVSDVWEYGVGWCWDRMSVHLPDQIMLQMRARVLDLSLGEDRMAWGESQDGAFTFKSAYAFLTHDLTPRANVSCLFQRVWSVVAPERVRVFLWMGMNQALMTNMERLRRHLCASDICQICKGGEESIIHILRDCPAMEGIWRRVVPVRKRRQFFEKPLIGWLYDNLGDHEKVGDTVWSTLFAIAVWWGWKWRCGNIFGVNGKCRDRVRFVKELATEVTLAHKQGDERTSQAQLRVDKHISWTKPLEGWVKLNTDGASRGNPGLATAGGVFRNEVGEWNGGFAFNIGIFSALMAELWGLYFGLEIAWDRRIPLLEIEVDSQLVVGFMQTGISETHPLSFLVHLCHGLLSRDWIVRIKHVYREANRLANGLANYAFTLTLGLHMLELVPMCVNDILVEDTSEVSTLRSVRL